MATAGVGLHDQHGRRLAPPERGTHIRRDVVSDEHVWPWIGFIALVVAAAVVLTTIIGSRAAKETNIALAEAGLQQCQTVGGKGYVWQRECER